MKVKLANENFTSDYLKNLLAARGVTDIEEFLDPSIKELNSPELFDNMTEGAKLLTETLQIANSKILIVILHFNFTLFSEKFQ